MISITDLHFRYAEGDFALSVPELEVASGEQVAVIGPSGSGKTTVVEELLRSLKPAQVSVIHHDSYYRDRAHMPFEDRVKINYDHPKAFETDLLVEHLKALKRGQAVDVPVYDYATHARTGETARIEPAHVVIVEGLFTLHWEALRDLLALQDRLVSIENIQKTVADYFNIRASDLLSSKRSRTIARPRQVAMALAKELTNHSLPEIGENFGGRDHTTVLYATRKVAELRDADNRFNDDYQALLRILSH